MKNFEEFRKKVLKAIESSDIVPARIIEQETTITISIENPGHNAERLKKLSAYLEAEKIRFRSSVLLPAQNNTVQISVYHT
ncbi:MULTISPECIES: hypothetical protein [Emticicia]|uniref:hypothetical protein n=1 Tax=Emticicia TaxID=312278 RepID=UPI0020A1A863|nr:MULTISPECIES: hypothetical protein [Emticicia]UTA66547.1 hypothetical protein MB380_13150 [Emticicia sp. 21SJ11W-3]